MGHWKKSFQIYRQLQKAEEFWMSGYQLKLAFATFDHEQIHGKTIWYGFASVIGGNGRLAGSMLSGGTQTEGGPSGFSYWAAALGFILSAGYLYSQGNGLTASLIGGGVAALLFGTLFDAVVDLVVFIFKLALFIAILLGAGFLLMQFLR